MPPETKAEGSEIDCSRSTDDSETDCGRSAGDSEIDCSRSYGNARMMTMTTATLIKVLAASRLPVLGVCGGAV